MQRNLCKHIKTILLKNNIINNKNKIYNMLQDEGKIKLKQD